MKEISWKNIINGYKDHITQYNLRRKTTKQLQEEGIGSCQTYNPAKEQLSVSFSTFFAVASQNLLVQSYISRSIALFKQILATLQEEKDLIERIVKIINELLTTLVYKVILIVSECKAAIFIRTLI